MGLTMNEKYVYIRNYYVSVFTAYENRNPYVDDGFILLFSESNDRKARN